MVAIMLSILIPLCLEGWAQAPSRHACTSACPAKHLCDAEIVVLLFVCSRHRVLLGASGSVAAIKVVELAYLLADFAEVKLVLTKAARHFIQQDGLPFVIHGMACSNASHTCVLQKQTCSPHLFALFVVSSVSLLKLVQCPVSHGCSAKQHVL